MGLGPESCAQTGTGRPVCSGRPVAQGRPDIRWSLFFRYFHSVKATSDVWSLRTSTNFGSGAVTPVVRSSPDVRSLGLG